MSNFLCILTTDRYDECLNCGGSATLGGTQMPILSDRGRFCSEDCAADAEGFAQRDRAWHASDWCPSCGFDNHEHAEDCDAVVRQTDGSVGGSDG